MKIIIATGIYPPDVGGPANYAKRLNEELTKKGHEVLVVRFSRFLKYPSWLRHILYFFELLRKASGASFMLALDTYSVAWPAIWVKILTGKKVIIRAGGDFLWEQYVERTGGKILLSKFYNKKRPLNLKERIIFVFTRFIFFISDRVVFNTEWHRDIFLTPYNISRPKTSVIRNAFSKKNRENKPLKKNFICFVRDLKWKNVETLRSAFSSAQSEFSEISLEIEHSLDRDELLRRMKNCYAVVLVSLGDVSPNFVSEALSFGKPIILTNETGILSLVGNVVFLVDPLDEKAIADAIRRVSDNEVRNKLADRAWRFSFSHSYENIAEEFIELSKQMIDP